MDFEDYPYLVNDIIMSQRSVYPYIESLRKYFGPGKVFVDFLEFQKNEQRELSNLTGNVIQIYDIAFGGIREMVGGYNDDLWLKSHPAPSYLPMIFA